MKRSIRAVSLTAIVLAIAACGGGDGGGSAAEGERLSGTITVDGSSTVFPITEAVLEEFRILHGAGMRVTAGSSGTGSGFKRFCAGEIDISDASRPIKDTEKQACQEAGIDYIEIPVAYDGLSVVVHPQNSFVTCLTVPELKKVWEPESKVNNWSQVRAGFPNQPLKLYGPGTNSGTFDYFTEVITGKAQASRADYTASEDDNVLVQGVSGDPNSFGYFGHAYYESNKDKLKLVSVDGGSGCVAASTETIKSGEYKPLSRLLYIYVSKKSLERPEVAAFVRFYNEKATELVPQVGYVPLDASKYQENLGTLGTGPTTSH